MVCFCLRDKRKMEKQRQNGKIKTFKLKHIKKLAFLKALTNLIPFVVSPLGVKRWH
jgi:hypothetical protein